MSITSVQSQIKSAMKDSFITKAEAQKIVKEAEQGPVTVGESKVIRELFERAPTPPPAGRMFTLAIPENPSDVIFEQGAKSVLETFFVKNDVPAGKNLKKFVDQIEAKLSADGRGNRLDKAPDTKKLHMVRLPYPERVMDYPSRTAFLDPKKNEFYLCVAGGLMAPGPQNTHWYGPIKLDSKPVDPPADPKVSDQRKGQLLRAFENAEAAGRIGWQVQQLPLGQRFVSAHLKNDGHPLADGFSYTALIPVGALTPTAPVKDPNKVEEFYVQRSGGFAGITTIAGPFRANVLPGDGSGWGHGIDRRPPSMGG